MKQLKSCRDALSVMITLIFLVPFTLVSATTAPIIDPSELIPASDDHDLSGFLTYRNIEKSPILQKATIIFQTKLSDSTPLQDAALELLKTCKSAEELSTTKLSPDSIKDAAKSTYAIKAALVSLASANVREPKSCTGFSVRSERFTFLAALNREKGQASQNFAGERSLCVGDLWKTDNSWTSYSNGLQDANTLCQVPSLENAQRAILDLLSDVNNIIPAWLDTFGQSEQAHLEFIRHQKAHAEMLDELQRRQRENMEDHHDAAKSAMESMMAATKSHVDTMTVTLREELISAGLSIEDMRKAVRDYVSDFLMLRDEQTRTSESYRATFSNAVAVQSRGLSEVQDTVQSVVESLEHVYGGLEDQVHAISTHLGAEMRNILQLQDQMKGGQEELLKQQHTAIQHQTEISGFASQLKGEIADMTTAVSSVTGALETVGSLWRGVQSLIGRSIASLFVVSFLLLIFGFRWESAVSTCLGALLWLFSPVLRHISVRLVEYFDVTGTCLAFVGRELFIIIVSTPSAVATKMPGFVSRYVAIIGMKYLVLATILAFAGYCAVGISAKSMSRRRPRSELLDRRASINSEVKVASYTMGKASYSPQDSANAKQIAARVQLPFLHGESRHGWFETPDYRNSGTSRSLSSSDRDQTACRRPRREQRWKHHYENMMMRHEVMTEARIEERWLIIG